MRCMPSSNGSACLKKKLHLTDLLKKGAKWVRTGYCQEAFDKLKQVVTKELMLWLLDIEKPFEVNTDASGEAIVVLCL